MKRILILIILTLVSCVGKNSNTPIDFESITLKLSEKENKIDSLQHELKLLRSKLYKKDEKAALQKSSELKLGTQENITRKRFIDTLDVSDNFFVYDRDVEIIKSTGSDYENFMDHFSEVKSIELSGVKVLVMNLLNEKSLPLETENWNSEIHILVKPYEFEEKNSFFIVSDFHYVTLLQLKEDGNEAVLTFEHGKFPRKKEELRISYDMVRFEK